MWEECPRSFSPFYAADVKNYADDNKTYPTNVKDLDQILIFCMIGCLLFIFIRRLEIKHTLFVLIPNSIANSQCVQTIKHR